VRRSTEEVVSKLAMVTLRRSSKSIAVSESSWTQDVCSLVSWWWISTVIEWLIDIVAKLESTDVFSSWCLSLILHVSHGWAQKLRDVCIILMILIVRAWDFTAEVCATWRLNLLLMILRSMVAQADCRSNSLDGTVSKSISINWWMASFSRVHHGIVLSLTVLFYNLFERLKCRCWSILDRFVSIFCCGANTLVKMIVSAEIFLDFLLDVVAAQIQSLVELNEKTLLVWFDLDPWWNDFGERFNALLEMI